MGIQNQNTYATFLSYDAIYTADHGVEYLDFF